VRVCKNCKNCAASKQRDQKIGLLPPKPTPEIIPWHTLCIDLVGPYKFGEEKKPETYIELHCVTMVDPATGFFETVEIGQKTADVTANWLEIHWLTRHPWPTEMTMDKGREFSREVSETLQNECGIKRKIVTSRNPQSNSMIERCHKTLHSMIRSAQIKDKRDLDSLLGFKVRRHMGSALEDPVPSVGSLMKPALTICLKTSSWYALFGVMECWCSTASSIMTFYCRA